MKLAAGNCRVESLRLVDNEDRSLCVLAGKAGHVLIRGGQAFARVDNDDCNICLCKSPRGLVDHALVDPLLATGHTASVDDQVWNGPKLAEAVLAITS